jgi:16S rRNA U1498 N3-methylase RsmE
MNRIEMNLQTGETKLITLTQEEEDDANARTAAEQAEMAARIVIDPVQKLKEFLATNQDVLKLILG